MIACDTVRACREEIRRQRAARSRCSVGLVPTMGALHDGHRSLIAAARRDCDVVVVSIFVNPTQFSPGEDFEQYPRSLAEDLAQCDQAGVDVVFKPGVSEMYPAPVLTSVRVQKITEGLCARHRPGHFEGVALVVGKLFNIVQPDRAYFGQKDAQQAAMVRRLTADLMWPIDIQVCPIVRGEDGLALSSRNAYLDPSQRHQATALYRSLLSVREAVSRGQRDCAALIQRARDILQESGPCRIDYVAVVDARTMEPVDRVGGPVMAAVAVWIGNCRLIDNMVLDEIPAAG